MQLFNLKSVDENVNHIWMFPEQVDKEELQKTIYEANNYYFEHENDYWCQYDCLYEKISEKYYFEEFDENSIEDLYW